MTTIRRADSVAPIRTLPSPDAPKATPPPQAPITSAAPVKDLRATKLSAAGPVSDTDPVLGVYVHALAQDLAPELVKALNATYPGKIQTTSNGYGGPQVGYAKDPNLVWIRDYFPIWTRTKDGDLRLVKTSSPNPNRSQTDLATYVPVAPPAPGQQLYRAPNQTTGGRWLNSDKLGLNHEAGNFVVAGSYAFVTKKLVEDNGPNALDTLAKAVNMPRSHLIAVDPMPGEKTGHADLSILALPGGKVMIPEIRDEALQTITYGHEIDLGAKVKDHLNKQAALLTALGLDVVRLPMMPPVYLQPDASQPTGYNGAFYSPANSLLIDDGNKKAAFVPTFDAAGFPQSYKDLNTRYQDEWKQTFTALGYETQLLDATTAGKSYGLFRCLTSTQPV